jgi:hypothetical protein
MKVMGIHTEHTHTNILHCCPQKIGINTFGGCALTSICASMSYCYTWLALPLQAVYFSFQKLWDKQIYLVIMMAHNILHKKFWFCDTNKEYKNLEHINASLVSYKAICTPVFRLENHEMTVMTQTVIYSYTEERMTTHLVFLNIR